MLQHLKGLRLKISDARAALAPFEADLEMAYTEYQDKISPLRREASRLQAQIDELRERIRVVSQLQPVLPLPEPDNGRSSGMGDGDGNEPSGSASQPFDADAVDKDKLLEHAYRVLDSMTDPADAELIGQLQGLISDPKVKLGDLLEGLDWGPVWEKRSREETLADQHRRLTVWERALTVQIVALERGAGLLRQDRRYGLWQQRQKGRDHWASFLDSAAQQLQDEITDLQVELQALSEHWTRLVTEI